MKRLFAPKPGCELDFVPFEAVEPHDDWTDLEQDLFGKLLNNRVLGEIPTWWIEPDTRV